MKIKLVIKNQSLIQASQLFIFRNTFLVIFSFILLSETARKWNFEMRTKLLVFLKGYFELKLKILAYSHNYTHIWKSINTACCVGVITDLPWLWDDFNTDINFNGLLAFGWSDRPQIWLAFGDYSVRPYQTQVFH